MSVSQLNTVVNTETNNYYDVILFAAELAPKNDFSLEYANGKVNLDKLSIKCLKYFLNRFKNFDIFPSRLTVSENSNNFNIELNSIDIYENCTKNLKLERPINRCTNVTLEILACIQFLLDIFNGLIFSLIINNGGDFLELCGVTSEFLSIIVEKMRQFQIIPKKIHFSSKSNFHIVFNRDSLFLLTENNGKYINCVTVAAETVAAAVNGGESSRNNSFMSTEDFPVSHESLKSAIIDNTVKSARFGVGRRKKKVENTFLEGEIDNTPIKTPRIMRKVREQKEIAKSDTFLCLKEKKKNIKTKKTAKSATIVSVTKIKKPRQKKLSKVNKMTPPLYQNVMDATDIDSGFLNASNWFEFQKKQKVFLDETINSILNQDQYLSHNNNSIAPSFIKEEATVSSTINNNDGNKARLIFTSNPNSNSTLIYSSAKSSANNNSNNN